MTEIIDAQAAEVLPTLQRLIDRTVTLSSKRAAVIVFDHRLAGPGQSHDEVSIFTVMSDQSPADMQRTPEWRIISEFGSTYEGVIPTVSLLGSRPRSTLSKPLVLMLDVASVDLPTICRSMHKLGDRFSSIDLFVYAGIDHETYAKPALDLYLSEARIALRAVLGAGTVSLLHDGPGLDIDPSPISGAKYATSLGHFLQDLAGGPATGSQLQVVTLHVQIKRDPAQISDDPPEERPFFTVLTRTQGKRMHTLRDVFCCLAAQTCMDFEHLIVGHNLGPAAERELDALVATQPDSLRSRIRLSPVNGGTRTVPLNHGFTEARGLYTIILDDDDLVFANWLETFRDLAGTQPGRLLRATSVRQEYEQVTVNGRVTSRAVSGMIHEYGSTFDHVQHLVENKTPPVSIAFPMFLFNEIGFKFDETLTTTEDWDYIVRCAGLVDVACSDEITSIYRWWVNAASSRTDHLQAEWVENHERIFKKMDGRAYLIPTSSTAKIRDLSRRFFELERHALSLRDKLDVFENAMMEGVVRFSKDALPVEDLLDEIIPMLGLPRFANGGEQQVLSRLELKELAVTRSGIFDPDYYLEQNRDVLESGMPPLKHFAEYGSAELRNPGPEFNALFYYVNNSDIRQKRVDPFFHYIAYGKAEGRKPKLLAR